MWWQLFHNDSHVLMKWRKESEDSGGVSVCACVLFVQILSPKQTNTDVSIHNLDKHMGFCYTEACDAIKYIQYYVSLETVEQEVYET